MKNILAFLFAIFVITSCSNKDCPEDIDYDFNTIKIAGLLPLSENLVDVGTDSKAVMESTINEMLDIFAANQNGKNIIFTIDDTQLNPDIALSKMKDREAEGYNIFIGPASSAELMKVRTFANSKGLLVISNYSTAQSLSVNDNVFRYCPSGELECETMAELISNEGIESIVPIFMNDETNKGLYSSVKKYFEKSGGKCYKPTYYATESADYDKAIQKLRDAILVALDKEETDKVAVYYAGFSEMNEILERAADDPVFSNVRWYGGAGLTKNPAILESQKAMEFAQLVRLTAPTMGLDKRLTAGVFDENTNGYAITVADAVWNVVTAASKVYVKDINVLKKQFVLESNRYFGYTGNTELDENGDRKYGQYDFYQIQDGEWKITQSYDSFTKMWKDCE